MWNVIIVDIVGLFGFTSNWLFKTRHMQSSVSPESSIFSKNCPYNYSGIVETRGSHLYLVLRSNSEFYTTHIRRVWRYYTKVVIRINKSKDRQHNDHKRIKGQTTIYKTLHRKLKIEQHEPHYSPGWTPVLRKNKQFLLH